MCSKNYDIPHQVKDIIYEMVKKLSTEVCTKSFYSQNPGIERNLYIF